jgi:hypothetical protein
MKNFGNNKLILGIQKMEKILNIFRLVHLKTNLKEKSQLP